VFVFAGREREIAEVVPPMGVPEIETEREGEGERERERERTLIHDVMNVKASNNLATFSCLNP
jgi:hypothetical protein